MRAVIPKSMQRDAAVRGDEQVARVQVAVEDAVHHAALGEPDHTDADHLVGVDAGGLHRLEVLEARIRAAAPSPAPAG